MGAHNLKSKCFYNAKPLAYYFYVKTKITIDFQICINVKLFDVNFGEVHRFLFIITPKFKL